MDIDESPFLNTKEVAKLLGLSQSCIRAWQYTSRIPFTKLGRSVKFKRSDIEKILEGGLEAVKLK